MIILLIYGKVAEPATLILHGNDGKTWVSFADTAMQRADAHLIRNIRQVLASLVTTNA
jgi:hypothetical protein